MSLESFVTLPVHPLHGGLQSRHVRLCGYNVILRLGGGGRGGGEGGEGEGEGEGEGGRERGGEGGEGGRGGERKKE